MLSARRSDHRSISYTDVTTLLPRRIAQPHPSGSQSCRHRCAIDYNGGMTADANTWPSLSSPTWPSTCASLHMWTQMVGKVRLALGPNVNHWWGVALYVTARGLTTSPIPYGDGAFEIVFDFIDH